MRDIVFFVAFLILAYFAMRRPYIAMSLWLWSGQFVPSQWLYGFASGFSYNSAFAFITISGYLLSKNKLKVKVNGVLLFAISFFVYTILTSINTIAFTELVWIEWQKFAKVFLLFFFSILILKDQHHFKMYIWAIVFSIGFYGSIEGLKFIASGGGHKINGPNNSILYDNNHLAVAIIATIPMIIYLIGECKEKYIKVVLIGATITCILAVLGTHSRGGLLGLMIVGGYFWLRSDKKILSLLGVIFILAVSSSYLPDSWFDRMNTIETATEDTSFMNRVNSWKIHTQMAIERPFLGGGFKAPQYGFVWRSLAEDLDKFDFIPTPYVGEKGWAAHSLYFQVLGDHGFMGFFLYMSLIGSAFLSLSKIEKRMKALKMPNAWQVKLAKMLKVSLLAFCTGGAAVSIPYIEIFWSLLACTAALLNNVKGLAEKELPLRVNTVHKALKR
jgi:probable O-glycosylation ligase (exosortase A-associated)